MQLVSVSILTYNSALFIEETLESVYNQTYANIELIVSDDCSKDNTVALITKWCEQERVKKRFTDVKIITVPKNTGISANYNRALNAVTGQWIKFCSGDDALRETCLEKNMAYVIKNSEVKVLFSYCRMYVDYFTEDCFLRLNPGRFPSKIINESIDAAGQYKLLLVSNKIPFTPSVFINTTIHKKFGIIRDDLLFSEDYQLWLGFTKNNIKLHFMEEETMNYRVHDESVSKQKTDYIVNPIYFKTEPSIKALSYPNLPWDLRCAKIYYWYVCHLFKIDFLNKKNKFTLFLFYFITKLINPFHYIIYFKSRYLTQYKNNLFYKYD